MNIDLRIGNEHDRVAAAVTRPVNDLDRPASEIDGDPVAERHVRQPQPRVARADSRIEVRLPLAARPGAHVLVGEDRGPGLREHGVAAHVVRVKVGENRKAHGKLRARANLRQQAFRRCLAPEGVHDEDRLLPDHEASVAPGPFIGGIRGGGENPGRRLHQRETRRIGSARREGRREKEREHGRILNVRIIRSMAANPKRERQRVRCVINGKEIDVWQGYRLWDAALEADARLWKWCGGDGLCGTCAVLPVSGGENLSPPTRLEKFTLATWFLKPLAASGNAGRTATCASPARPMSRGPSRSSACWAKRAAPRSKPTAWSRPRRSVRTGRAAPFPG